MNLLNYDDVINFLEGFFLKMIKDPTCIHEMKLLLGESRRHKTVPIRAIDELFMMYRKKQETIGSLNEKMRLFGSRFLMFGNSACMRC